MEKSVSFMEQEIFSQPVCLQKTYEEGTKAAKALAEAGPFGRIFLVARGSSANAAMLFKYLCEIAAGIPAEMIYPSVYTLFDGHIRMTDPSSLGKPLVLAVSQGGRGEDVRICCEKAKKDGAFIAAMTNDPASPLAKMADLVIPLSLPEERSMAATKSFSAELLQLLQLAGALSASGGKGEERADGDEDRYAVVPDIYAKVLALEEAITGKAEGYIDAADCFVLGRGWQFPVAREICCKLQETCFINATPYSTADFLHGPYALIQPGRRVIQFIADDEGLPCGIDMLQRMQKDGADVLLFTDSPEAAALCENTLLLPRFPKELSAFAFTAAAQVFACRLSALRGIDPDVSRNLSKYTVTK